MVSSEETAHKDEQLSKLFELYLANQAATNRFAVVSTIGVALVGVVLAIGFAFAWVYYSDARDLLTKVQSDVAAAENARADLAKLRSDFEATRDSVNKLQAIPSVQTLLQNTDAISASLVSNQGFTNELTRRIVGGVGNVALSQLEFFMTIAEGGGEQKAECPTEAKFVGGTCWAVPVGDDGQKPLFGPKNRPPDKSSNNAGCKLCTVRQQ